MVPSLTNAAPVAGVPQPSTLNVAPGRNGDRAGAPEGPVSRQDGCHRGVSDAVEATVPVTTN